MIKFCVSVILMFAAACSASPKLSGTVEYEREGSRSEARNGYLEADGIMLPDCFTAVLSGEDLYVFSTRKHLWGDSGYFPADYSLADSLFPAVEHKITAEELSRGWAETKGRCKLPEGWLMVKWNGGCAALLPKSADALAEAKALKPIPRLAPPPMRRVRK